MTFGSSNDDGVGNIEDLVDDEFSGRGIGDALLSALIPKSTEPLEAAICSLSNPSREFYRRHGFVEYGEELSIATASPFPCSGCSR